jgi:hypothetical protein
MTQSQKVTNREDRAGTVVRALDVVAGILNAVVLGLDSALDHRMFVPGHTLWTGSIDGLEVQVRSVLRQAVGAVR